MKKTSKILSLALCILLLSGIGVGGMQAQASNTSEEIEAKQQELSKLCISIIPDGHDYKLRHSYKSLEALNAVLELAFDMLPHYQKPDLSYPEYTVEDYDRVIKNLQDAFDALEPPGIFDYITYFFRVIQEIFKKLMPFSN